MKRWILAALVALCVFQALTSLFWLPISAHSGQTTIPWLMNEGKVLFGDVLEQHAPGGSLVAAAAQRLLPADPLTVAKLLNVALVISITLAVYALAAHVGRDARAGLAAALVWAWWLPVYGNVLFYFNTTLALCVLLAVWVLLAAGDARPGAGRWLLAGLLMGLATLFKQHAWAAVGLLGLWLLIVWRSPRGLLLYSAGALLLPVLLVLAVAAQGHLAQYLYWNWTFNLSGLMDGVPLDGPLFRKLLLTVSLVPAFVLRLPALPRPREGVLLLLLLAATAFLLYPRFGEGQATGFLPFAAIMSGVALAAFAAQVPPPATWAGQVRRLSPGAALTAGLLLALAAGWLWTGAVSYLPTRLGPGGAPAYDEFRPLVAQMAPLQVPGATLFVLPQTDSTPQLHPLTGMLPPGTWIKGWSWYFEAPGVVATLLDEWAAQPPTFVVVFPELLREGEPGIVPLVDFVQARYTPALRVDDIFLHGSAVVYRLREGPPTP
ncbi:MAG: glycosyltransferase family 39 protein [Anaerolineae bacterium]|nr:glycosyltransferase family 39 protein [Anaerolineae bacterium]